MERPRIFYILNYGSAVRNIVRGGVMEHLLHAGYDFVLFAVNERDRQPIREAFGDRAIFEDLGETPFRGLSRAAQRLRSYLWRTKVNYDERLMYLGEKKTWLNRFQSALAPILQMIPFSFWEWWAAATARWPRGEELLAKYQPVGVIISNPLADENCVIDFCRRRGVYTACVLESWDNLTNRGALYSFPRDIFVWNNLIRRQAIELHNYPPDRVQAVGIPSFDLYAHPESIPTEAQWREENKLPPVGPVIVYTSSSVSVHKSENEIIDILLKARDEGRLPREAHLLIRFHPRDDFSVYRKYEGQPGITIQYPDLKFKTLKNDATINDGSPGMLAATMRYAAVVINVFSTICLDALANGTPVVVICFDPQDKPFHQSVRRYLLLHHIKELVSFNAVSLAETPADLIRHTNTYLQDKQHNLENRRKCLEAEAHRLDGQAAAGLAALLDRKIRAARVRG